jgi:hypothetical protein
MSFDNIGFFTLAPGATTVQGVKGGDLGAQYVGAHLKFDSSPPGLDQSITVTEQETIKRADGTFEYWSVFVNSSSGPTTISFTLTGGGFV